VGEDLVLCEQLVPAVLEGKAVADGGEGAVVLDREVHLLGSLVDRRPPVVADGDAVAGRAQLDGDDAVLVPVLADLLGTHLGVLTGDDDGAVQPVALGDELLEEPGVVPLGQRRRSLVVVHRRQRDHQRGVQDTVVDVELV